MVCVADFGITSGHQLPEYPCAFVFKSNETRNGTFASPNFPGFYPRDTECHYFFHGSRTEKVHLHFNYFDVEGVLPWVMRFIFHSITFCSLLMTLYPLTCFLRLNLKFI